jgi:acetyl-CoA C-acetyltransferase
MDNSRVPVIVGAARTPIGRYLGALSSLTAPQLGGIAIREAVERSGVSPDLIKEVIVGNVLQGGVGQAPARQAMLAAGLPASISAVTVNKVCGSGLKSVMLAAQAIRAGDADAIVAGGMESMSNAPHYVYGYRGGVKFGDQQLVDGMIRDGLWCATCNVHMGSHAEYTAKKAHITRERQDEFAAESHRRAIAAQEAGKFRAEIVCVEIPGKKGPTLVDADEGPRRDTTAQSLAGSSPRLARGAKQTSPLLQETRLR